MTPKEKAEQILYKYKLILITSDTDAGEEILCTLISKQCVLILVDEIIDSSPRFPNDTDWDDCGATHQYYYEAQREAAEIYWKEVKQEIKKL